MKKTKRSLKLFIILIVILLIILFSAIPSIIDACKNAEKVKSYRELDLKKNKGDYFVNDNKSYSTDMLMVVMPFINNYKQSGYFKTIDNFNIHYENYLIPGSTKNICLIHGFCENTVKYYELIYYFLKNGYSCFMIDLRGHGFSDRYVDDYSKVHIENFHSYVDDYKQYINDIVKPIINDGNLYLFAHSLGGAIGTYLLEECPKLFNKAILTSPMLNPKVSPLNRSTATIYSGVFSFFGLGKSCTPSSCKEFPSQPDFEGVSCGSQVRYDYYYNIAKDEPHYQTYCGTLQWLKEALKSTIIINILKNLKKIETPTLVFECENDLRVMPGAIHHFVNNVNNSELILVKDAKHELYNGYNEQMVPYVNTILEYLNI